MTQPIEPDELVAAVRALLRLRDAEDKPVPLGLPSWTGLLSPLVAAVVAVLGGIAWRAGIRRYRSTGS